ncbi:choice-of-anchor D domain-containing protein [Chloroflexales bacterium ZM16-3]|nr:choice-of-anchor D domain-containing protein [Chloroflexales bacterium ZM16-3]
MAMLIVVVGGSLLFVRGRATGEFCDRPGLSLAEIAAHRQISVEMAEQLGRLRSLSPAAICVIPQDKLDRAIFRVGSPKPDKPDEALAWRNLALRSEDGSIKPDGIGLALEHVAQMRAAEQNSPPAAGIAQDQWKWLGPGNIGGRIRALVIHPTQTSRMWAGSVSGGIWYSSNGGARWDPVDDFMSNLAVSTMVMAPTDSTVMYAGTGEGFYNSDGIQGAGIFKSTDGGVSWSQLNATANSNFVYVNRLDISPDGAVILAATRTSLFRSTNGGTSWTAVLASEVLDVNFNPNNATYAVAAGRNGAAWYSINGGLNWSTASGLPSVADLYRRVEIAYAPSVTTGAGTIYASVNVNSGEIWKSTDGGQSYSQVSTDTNYLGLQGWYDNIIWVAPDDPNTLIVGGIDLWKSTNGGATLTQVSSWEYSPFSAHADQHAIVADPGYNGPTNRTVYFGNDGGIYKAADINTLGSDDPYNTTGWQELNNNLGITQFYGAAGNASTGVIVGGTQDNGTLAYSGDSEGWVEVYGGDGGFSAADPNDANYFYGEYVRANVHRTVTGATADSGEYISGRYSYFNGVNSVIAWKPAPYTITDAQNSSANFIAPFILDPNDSNRMLVGGLSLWRTNDVKTPNTNSSGPSWAAIKSSIGGLNNEISAIAVAPGNSDIIWVGHNNGNVYKTTNGTAAAPTWTQVDTNGVGLPNRYANRIAIDPNNSSIVYVTFGGFNADNVYRSTDGGTTWGDRTGSGATGLPDAPVRSLVISPLDSNRIYVGTEVGIFASEDAGATWSLPHDGPSNVSVDELFWVGNTLTAATHGRGVYQALANAALSTGSIGFGNLRVSSTSAAQQVTLTNSGAADLKINSITASGDFARTTTCGSTLVPGANCTISVTFTPTATGARSSTLTITSSAAGSPQSVGLSGTGVVPGVSLSGSSLSFSSVTVGTTTAAQQVTLTNSGDATLTISSIAASGDFAPTTTCGATLAAGASCSVSVTFTPTATGTRSGTLTISDDATGSPHSVSLSGTGIAPAVSLSASSLSFGSQRVGTTSAAQQITLTNNGGASLTIASIVASGDFARTTTCGATLAAGASCTISVTFTPPTTGSRSGTLTISSNATGSPHSVSLSGAGATLEISLSASSQSFSSVTVGTTTAAQQVTLTNSGNDTLAISSIAASGDFARTTTCGATLAAGASCTISVTFTPTTTGSRSGTLTISSDAIGSPHSVSLSGIGATPAFNIYLPLLIR